MSHEPQYDPSFELPPRIIQLAQELTDLAEENGLTDWKICGVAERNQVERLEKELNAALGREKALAEALNKAQSHLDYCGWGDEWEREGMEPVKGEVEDVLTAHREAMKDKK